VPSAAEEPDVAHRLSAPFPWFGGKSRAAPLIWDRLGDVVNYVEPFFGSGAVLLGRPGGATGIETVNDQDGFVCVAPQTRVLMADLTYVHAGQVQVGDRLVAFDEENPGAPQGGMPDTWTAVRWKATGGYGNLGDAQGRINAARETLWCSTYCLRASQGRLW
jgi:hypothetical protein